MISKKKAELSINMIILVAIGVVVLIVTIFLILKGGGSANQEMQCPAKGGMCVTSDKCEGDQITDGKCIGGQICCPLANVKTG
jgi:hypothetical protein